MQPLEEALTAKIKTLSETIWEQRPQHHQLKDWLNNFSEHNADGRDERLHALFLLSNFVYFGSSQMRELLRSLFRDKYRYPLIESIRRAHDDTTDVSLIDRLFREELDRTRFLGIGNPSESGCHLLYYFRQENGLPNKLFIHSHEMFEIHRGRVSVAYPEVTRYVFIDDLSGSGRQAQRYSEELLGELKHLQPDCRVEYHVIFATTKALGHIRAHTSFDSVNCIFELDESFRCFSPQSRYFTHVEESIDRAFAEELARRYGLLLYPRHALGFDDCQLLLGFHHNTPNNSLPIIWSEGGATRSWSPIFRRYPKRYGLLRP